MGAIEKVGTEGVGGQVPVVQQGSQGSVSHVVSQGSGALEGSQVPAGVEEFVVALPAKQQLVLKEILATGNVSEVSRRTGVGRSTSSDTVAWRLPG